MREKNKPRVLITGGAGFIGSHLSDRLLKDGHDVWHLNCLNIHFELSMVIFFPGLTGACPVPP
jgi:nucleoside-diphosphate-sugar epimerase